MLALEPEVLLLVQLWCMSNPSGNWSSSRYQQKTRKTEKERYFPGILVISIRLPQSWRSARVKVREGQGCTARTGKVRPSRSRELLRHLSHLSQNLSLMERCAPSLWAGCRVAGWALACCQMPRAKLCSSSHRQYYGWSTSHQSIPWNLKCK